jgi:gamma-glutamylcyclotransferase (GGCT)/AIG2-like uncharacterized protein YtfP
MYGVNGLSPDEDAVFGEIMDSNSMEVSVTRFDEIATKYNMTYDRVYNAFLLLHSKGWLYVPVTGEMV